MMQEDLNLSSAPSFAESLAPYDEVMDDTPIVTPKALPEFLEDDEEMIAFESNVFDNINKKENESSVNPRTNMTFIPQPPRSYMDLEVGSSGVVVCGNDSHDNDSSSDADDMMKQYLEDAEKTSVLVGRDWLAKVPTQLTWTVAGAIFICCLVPVVIVVGVFVRSMRLAEAEDNDDGYFFLTPTIMSGMDSN